MQAQSLRTSLQGARNGVGIVRTECKASKVPRDEAIAAMRKRLSGLVAELKQRLGPDDPRWTAFGLNQPGATSTPAVPENVAAVSYGANQLFVTCDGVPLANHYRFFTQAYLEEAEPVFAGDSSTPTLVIPGLQGGQIYQVYVSAANAAGESNLSEPATATPQAMQRAA